MEKIIEDLLMLSGIIFWLLIILIVFILLVSKNKKLEFDSNHEYKDTMWCNECEEETEHIIRGIGFNQTEQCLKCQEIEDKII